MTERDSWLLARSRGRSLEPIARKVVAGERLSRSDALSLMTSGDRPLLGLLADHARPPEE